nr:hypothetical protein [Moraxella sp. CTOTU48717]
MNIEKIKQAKNIRQVFAELKMPYSQHTEREELLRFIGAKFREEWQVVGSEQALITAKRRIVTAMGGTTEQWHEVSQRPKGQMQLI